MDFVKISLLFIFTVIGLMVPHTLFAKTYKATKEEVNVRLDSTISSKSIGNLSNQETVEVIDEKYGWYKIKLPARLNCWVWSNLVKKTNKDTGVINKANVNIRNQPSLDGEIIGLLNKNDQIIIRSEKKDWLEISCYPHAHGWVHSKLLIEYTSKEEEINPYKKITALSQKGKNNPDLISHFFAEVKSSSLEESALYLDVLENILLEKSPKLPFYYLTTKNKLSNNTVQKTYDFLKEIYQQGI